MDYSSRMPARRMTPVHFSISARRRLSSSAGVLPMVSATNKASFSRKQLHRGQHQADAAPWAGLRALMDQMLGVDSRSRSSAKAGRAQ